MLLLLLSHRSLPSGIGQQGWRGRLVPWPGHWCAGYLCPRGCLVSLNLLPGICVQQDAVRALNTLQTNASYLEQAKRQRGDPQTQLEAMKLYLVQSGLQVKGTGLVTPAPHTCLCVSLVADLGTLSLCPRWRTWTS